MTLAPMPAQAWAEGPIQRGWPPFPGPPWGWGQPHPHGCGCGHCPPPQECWPPGCPPGPGWDWNWRPPVGAIRGPIIGVTDGSLANPGEVGEFLFFKSPNLTITMAQNGVPQFLATLIVPPGDWNCTLQAGAQFIMEGFNASLDPIPPGMNPPGVADAAFVELDMAPTTFNAFTGERSFALALAQPQLITVNYHAQGIIATSFDANNVAGQITVVILVTARRMR